MPARSYHASKKIKNSHATAMKKDHAWVSIKSKKQSYVQMKLYQKQDIDNVLHIQPMHICFERRQRFN